MKWSEEIARRWRDTIAFMDRARDRNKLIIPADEAEAALDRITELEVQIGELDDASDEEQ